MEKTKENFFDKFWKPYLEYEAALGYSRLQLREEINDLEIKTGDRVINIGFNWGDSLIHIAQNCDPSKIVGVDSSRAMLHLSTQIFSTNEIPSGLIEGLSSCAKQFLFALHQTANRYQNKVQFYHCVAEDLDSLGLTADKIAATMGLHWLADKKRAFTAFNRSLVLGGAVTFSTASSRFKVVQQDLLFHHNSYYHHFLTSFAELYDATHPQQKMTRAKPFTKTNLETVIGLVETTGFALEKYRELSIYIPKVVPSMLHTVTHSSHSHFKKLSLGISRFTLRVQTF